MMKIRFWVRISLFNLLLVALFGTVMRYKIGFEFPYFNQKNLQHAHSHFAFVGWITQIIYVLMVKALEKQGAGIQIRKYVVLLAANLICSYVMLASFGVQGYGFVSIAFSTLSVVISYIFAFVFFRDLKQIPALPSRNWFVAALWFSIISSVGTFTLAYMMATHNFDQKMHLASLYYYLHFQYNGFFFFACVGLLISGLSDRLPAVSVGNGVFWLFFTSCIPAYFLSVLWGRLPLWLFTIVVASAIAQVIAWIGLLKGVSAKLLDGREGKLGRMVLIVVAAALTAKFLLQLGSTVPAVSKLAFGFRPVIIAYLHLILLAIISVFLVVFLYINGFISRAAGSRAAILCFVVFVYLNELVLGVQGVASFSYTMIPYVNETLFVISAGILLSLLALLISQLAGIRRFQKQIT